MRYILIPVKDLSRAKQRLAALMTQEERTRLAWAMFETTLTAALGARNADRIALVTLYGPAISLAERLGVEVITETEQISESASVDFGSREACRRGAEAVLRLPIDLPLIATEDLEKILDHDRPPSSVVIVPSRDQTGTNALLRRPPDLFPSHFGPGSLQRHLEEAERSGTACQVLRLPRIALDIDDPSDLAVLMAEGRGTPIYEILIEIGVQERLKPGLD
ncbi:MAG TPA: 2-phospho-L-lactate guanylyltransferase [Blastocatellia bacterium]|nr:2-phospho-L-lactate guanylyltransferase [Blastocatellia bacterium]